MEQFIVSARKYRPETFESLIGQGNIATTLKNSILRGQLAHAYLFCGPRGVGKTTSARIFAKSINCLNPGPDMEPCGKCESCLSFKEGRSYCIHELDAASNNSVDDIRNLTEMVRIPPQVGKYSVFIIDEVHMLSSAAFNAFLKTLEEPPAHAIFILATTEKHKILPTILSRCQTYDFNRISVPDIVGNLEKIASEEGVKIDSDSLHVIAIKGDGSMRDALTLFDQVVAFCGKDVHYEDVVRDLNVLDYEYYFKITENSLSGDYIASLLLLDEILAKGFNAIYFISGLSSHFRDLLVCRNAGAESLLSLSPSLVERYKAQAERCTVGFLFNALSITSACESGYRLSGNQRLHIELALMKLAAPVALASEPKQAPAAERKPLPEQKNVVPKPVTAPEVPKPVAEAQPVRKQMPVAVQSPAPTQEMPKPAADTPKPAATSEPQIPSVGGGMSLKAMMAKAMQSETAAKTDEVTDAEEPLSEEAVNGIWKELAEEEKAAGRTSLAATMLHRALGMDIAETTVTLYVGNDAQRDWIREKVQMRLEGSLRKKLKNGKIKLIVQTHETAAGEKKEVRPYMPTEKAQRMLAGSVELREMKKELDLDVKI